MNLPALCVRRPVATAMFTLIVVIIGGFAFSRLPIDLLPEITLPTVTVRSQYNQTGPEEMERLVTRYIEESVAVIAGVEEITSVSGEGSSNVRVRFAWGTGIDDAANDVRARVDQVLDELPEDMPRPQISKFDINSFPIVILGVGGPLDPVELTTLIEEQLLYRFERVPGVASVDLWGEFNREIRVELDLARVRALGLPLDQILEAVRQANVNVPAGEIDRGRQEVTIRTPGEFESLDDLAATVVAMRERGPIQLRDIANIRDTFEEQTRLVRVDGETAVRLAIRKESEANTAQVAARILEEIDILRGEYPRLTISAITNQGQFIERSIANVGRSVLFGGGLAILVLLLFLRDLRSTLVIAVSIPISIIATLALVYFGGFTLNLMTLGGLALGVGMMVDNSIVVLENIFRREREMGESASVASVRGAVEVAGAIIASTATTLVIFLPLAFVEGVSGVMFGQFALVVAFSLAASLVVALTLVPMLSATVLRGDAESKRPNLLVRALHRAGDALMGAAERVYAGVLRDALRARIVTVTLAVTLFAAAVYLAPRIGGEFMPPSDEGEVRVTGTMEVGTRLDLVDRQTRAMEAIVFDAVPEVETSYVSVGASSWNPSDASEGEISLTLVPAGERARSNTEVAEDLRARLDGAIPGMEVRTRAPQGQRMLQRVLGTGDEGLEIEIRGHDLDVLNAMAGEVERAAQGVPGISDVRRGNEAGVPQELVRVDRQKTADLGVSVQTIARTLETTLGGVRVGAYREDGLEHNIRVRLENARSIPLEEILDITVRSRDGEEVALRNLVSTEPGVGPTVIDRKDQQRITTVSANVAGRDLGSVARELQAAIDGIPRPVGFAARVAGVYEEQQRAQRELAITFVLALVLVYMVLASLYESLRDPLVVMLAVPAAAIGVIGVLMLTGTTINLQSGIGCVMLGGIVVNNAILLVDQAGRLRREGRPRDEALMEAGRRRLRPILMTSLTTILGLLPLALGVGEGSEVQAPLAKTVIGGLAFSTLVTLILAPVAYSLAHPGEGGRKRGGASESPAGKPATA